MVNSKILRIIISYTRLLSCDVSDVIKKANELKWANIAAHDIIWFYRTCIMPVLE